MDIIDVMLARAMTPQGQTETYVSMAQAAAAKAAKAETDAQAAIDVVTNAAEDITAAQEAAADLLASAQEALETAQEAQINTLDTEDVDTEIKKMTVNTNTVDGINAKTLQVITTYPDNTLNTQNITKMYKAAGTNEDGTMTQKAIKNYVDSVAGSSQGGTIHFTTDDSGHIIVIDKYGNAVASEISENDLLTLLAQNNTYITTEGALGLEINYANKSFSRLQNAISLTAGTDFDQFIMYGGRMRCNVADDGTINAFYGDDAYRDDGTNGQVMVYQPKFYYQRLPLAVETKNNGQIIRRETLIISATPEAGFKLAPIFKSGSEELDYVLFSAYDGAIINNKLASVANSKPASNFTINEAEEYARERGTGWHITNLAAEATNQMLEIIEFGSMNGQESLELGICNITGINNVNCSSITGSTASLGNATGYAIETVNEINGATTNETTVGKRAISYRGIENPWGNIWHMIGGVNVEGGNNSYGGTPYICTDYNYTPGIIGSNYESIGFKLPTTYSWINAMGYGDSKYDWVFLPGECGGNANSLLPVGDNLWVISNSSNNRIMAVGGSYNLQENVGPFYYATDHTVENSARHNYGARLMFIPSKNIIYTENIAKWLAKMGV